MALDRHPLDCCSAQRIEFETEIKFDMIADTPRCGLDLCDPGIVWIVSGWPAKSEAFAHHVACLERRRFSKKIATREDRIREGNDLRIVQRRGRFNKFVVEGQLQSFQIGSDGDGDAGHQEKMSE